MSWSGFVQREISSQQMIAQFVGEVYTSIGDVERCSFLTHVSPLVRRQREAKGEVEVHIITDQLSFAMRALTLLKMVLVWQWNGRIKLRLHTSAKWTMEEGMKKFGEILSDCKWLRE
ncbi:hypothetical protein D9758_011958 [Tetrapyrgos nigripes]|uniref:Uncharacterized protein n=1 Tax=Tetrapyrgos nigripes TaxID=182062 RepID=A0A8H5FWF9_9AGAR|nr:hypothetical protein D9758_011958 [Tetrapyrgos nigripes]